MILDFVGLLIESVFKEGEGISGEKIAILALLIIVWLLFKSMEKRDSRADKMVDAQSKTAIAVAELTKMIETLVHSRIR